MKIHYSFYSHAKVRKIDSVELLALKAGTIFKHYSILPHAQGQCYMTFARAVLLSSCVISLFPARFHLKIKDKRKLDFVRVLTSCNYVHSRSKTIY